MLYGPVESLDESAVTCLLSVVTNSKKPVKVSDYERRNPSHVNDVATVLYQLTTARVAEVSYLDLVYE